MGTEEWDCDRGGGWDGDREMEFGHTHSLEDGLLT